MMRASTTLGMRGRLFVLMMASALLMGHMAAAQRSRSTKRVTTEAPPAYEDDDYDDEYDQTNDDLGAKTGVDTTKSSNSNNNNNAKSSVASSSSSSTTASPEDQPDEDADGGSPKHSHPFFRNRLRLKNRPSPQPAFKAKPTLPSFIKHPANIEDLGHEQPVEPRPTQPPLPRRKATTSKPHRFSSNNNSGLRKKHTPPPVKEEPREDYDDEDEDEVEKQPSPAPARKPLRPRRN